MIQNIIFDMGNVLIRWSPDRMLAAQALTDEERQILRTELFQETEWISQDRGTLQPEEVITAVCARLPESLHPVVRRLVTCWFVDHLDPMPQMGELVRELKSNGYHIYLLSNAAESLRSYFDRIPGASCFDGLMVSAEEKLLKPEHEIYERLYQRFHLDPRECWFIDDNPANVEGAMQTGMGGTIFRGDTVQLRRKLRAAGIRCEEG